MIKPESLRAALSAACPELARNPEMLSVRIERGEVHSTMHGGLSFEYQYDLVVLVMDYAGHADMLFLPIVAWLQEEQPDILLNPDRRQDFAFEVDVLDAGKCDIEIHLAKLTERVVVSLALATQPEAEQGEGCSDGGGGGHGVESEMIRIPIPEGLTGPGTVATVRHVAEPPAAPERQIERWEFWIDSKLVRTFDAPPFDGPSTP
ncbi:MAG: phage tail protein [Proteobacteria bacterium]|nr:phage tail protein [Pseudomonadota bacterium]